MQNRMMNRLSIDSTTLGLAALLAPMLACSGDDAEADATATESGSDGSTAGPGSLDAGDADSSGNPTSGVADTTSGSSTSDGATETGETSTETTGGVAPSTCTPTTLPGAIEDGVWDERFTLAGLTGRDGYRPNVYDIAADVDGSLLVGGYFRWADGIATEGLARHDDSGWSSAPAGWDGLAPSGFSAVGVGPDGEIVAATSDLAMQGDGEIWLDTGSGPMLIGNHTGAFRRFVWIDGVLWGVGRFQLENGGPIGLATWDGSTWSGAPGGDPDADVFEILPEPGGSVLVAGEFSQVGGIAAERVARLDGATWTALDMPESARVLALEYDDAGTLWAGGLFVLAPENLPSASLATWDGDAWQLADGGVAAGEATGVVSDLQFVEGAMIVAGCFDRAGGVEPEGTLADGIARVDDGTWESLAAPGVFGTAWFSELVCGYEPDPSTVFLMPNQRIHHDGSRLWLGGAFSGIEDAASQSIAAREDDAWQPVDEHGLGLSGIVVQLASGGESCAVYGLMAASHAGGEPIEAAVARWDDATGWTGASPLPPDGQRCDELDVLASGEPVIGCVSYDDVGGAFGDVFRLVDGAWESIGEFPGPVNDLEVAPDGTLWISGGNATGYLAYWDGGVPVVVEDGFDVLALLIAIAPRSADPADYDVLVGGPFTAVGDLVVNRIARWDGADWSALGDGLAATPSAIAGDGDTVWAGTYDEGVPNRLVLGRFADEAWEELATPAHGLADPFGFSSHTFTRLRVVDEGLVAVGYVWPETGGRNAFFFDGDQFQAIEGGIAAISVDDVLVTDDSLFFAGTIAEVGEGATLRSSVGVARFGW